MMPSSRFVPPPFFKRPAVRGFIAQVLLLLLLAGVITFFAVNASKTVARLSIATGFDFLWQSASFELGSNLIGFSAGDRFIDAFYAGIVNTLVVSSASIVVATIVGVLLGILRLSQNPLGRALAGMYVELVRNI